MNEVSKTIGSDSGQMVEGIINTLLKTPGIKVNRDKFLLSKFEKLVDEDTLNNILAYGPYAAGVKKSMIDNIAKATIKKRTLLSTSVSAATGLPGGFAMIGTIPADISQYFNHSLKLAQELAYLYGHEDMWLKEHVDTDKARNKLILFLGIMFGVSGSSTALKAIGSGVSRTILKKVPNKALTKTIYYPIIKKTFSYIGVKVTKDSFAKNLSKSVPIVGGVISGSITFFSMGPMGRRLAKELSHNLVITEEEVIEEFNKYQ